jgi:hypothetical protein
MRQLKEPSEIDAKDFESPRKRLSSDQAPRKAKVRVYELAKEFGVESRTVMAKLTEMGEFARSASSPIEAPVVRRLAEAFMAERHLAWRSGSRGVRAPRDGACCRN